jgi:acetyltransferase
MLRTWKLHAYITLPDARSCEFALVVADDWQRRGLGHALLDRLVAIARERGLERMVGWVSAESAAMLRLTNGLGFTDHGVAGDPRRGRPCSASSGRRGPAPSSA